MNAALTHLTAYEQLRWTQLVRAVGMPLVIVPITTLATARIRPDQSGSASALFNMLRNLCGSIGIALLATQLDVREKFHSFRLGESVTAFSPVVSDRLALFAQFFVARGTEAATGTTQAAGALADLVRREASVMAYGDCFYLLGTMLASTVLLVWWCRSVRGAAAAH
jgi:DHA2 family multidrug resistance protein